MPKSSPRAAVACANNDTDEGLCSTPTFFFRREPLTARIVATRDGRRLAQIRTVPLAPDAEFTASELREVAQRLAALISELEHDGRGGR